MMRVASYSSVKKTNASCKQTDHISFHSLVIRALVPSFANIRNTMPEGSNMTTQSFIGFILFWAFSLPALYFPVHQIRHLFTVKTIIVPTAGIGYLIWMIVKANGIGPIVSQPATISGKSFS